jgi:hypothetical protein
MLTLRPGTASAIVGSIVGPAAVVLHESGLQAFRAMPLLNVWAVCAFGSFGAWVGIRALRRGVVIVGVVCLLANAVVLGLYGFLATNVILGGD